jgi:hypothetical protein
MLLRDTQPGDRIVLVGTVQAPDSDEGPDKPNGFVSVTFDNGGTDAPKGWGMQGVIPCRLIPGDTTVEVRQVID